ncbi:T9SS-dependent M36 family metallopeptidase [Aureitalea marina]|uniref:Peptidase n=1 Tax=Aureitalea marina TaxID=930804 RepID=A0A2S7KRK5_9FLAO|nr:T9SS-dependent M36 family metallopeptidase [Aureitalea marina]PQB05218.1 hypothetical protein BST85_10235 [Aureitalea marina]
MKKLLLSLAVLASFSLQAQQDFTQVVRSYLNTNRATLGLNAQDFSDIIQANQSWSSSMEINNVYMVQRVEGIEIFNSTSAFAIANNGQVKYAAMSFVPAARAKINTTNPSINAASAISRAAQKYGLGQPVNLEALEERPDGTLVFSDGQISMNEIPVKLVFQPMEDGGLRLAWDLSIFLLDGSHYYSARIDAQTGELIHELDWVVSCSFGTEPHSHAGHSSKEELSMLFPASAAAGGSNQYRVFPAPIESPNHGNDQLVQDPSSSNASPFGWHDTNGSAGAEFTITRGNNVWAQEDRNANNGVGFSPDGGADLNFDFPFNFNTAPVNMQEAAITNLFYWNNLIHDVMYEYGFTEANGNFQENNYGNGGAGSDSVNADAQDGGGTNNATFGTPPDGNNPRMTMFLWSPSGPAGEPLTINGGPLAGQYEGIAAQFGAPLPSTPLTGDLALLEDNNAGESTDANDGCDPITNGGSLNGKIVVIRRGSCEFGTKILAAENQGAIAVIMVNNVGGAPIAMGAGAEGGSVTIPSIMVNQSDGEDIIDLLDGGGNINASLEEAGPYAIDGDVDNGIIVHEYGHGISNRLTGGPGNTGCLSNDEQMGEGWSDYFGLIMTMQPGDQGGDIRGIGTYAIGQPTNGGGIRPAPYSTDFAINDFTYANTNSGVSQPHGIGFVWATMLWDLTWALIDEYGFDADLYNGNGGNNIALQLVMDGLKLQNCSPGFVNGRDAILEADELANGGANRCLIWAVFANRGLGESASQGSAFNRSDQTEAFDLPVECTLGFEDRDSGNGVIIYPNPTRDQINLRSLTNIGDAQVTITDLNGRVVLTSEVDLSTIGTINTSALRAGLYLVQIQSENFTQTTKLIVQ